MSFKQSRIKDLESWFQYAPPKKPSLQWKCGRSAMELARYITSDLENIPDTIKSAIKYADEDPNGDYNWQPEYVTELPGSGEGRNHDLIIFGNKIVIGIEAKADESFDTTIKDWLQKGENNKDKGDNRRRRLDALCEIVFGKAYSKELFGHLRYQLLTALAGTIKEAQNSNKKKAMLLVITFKTHRCDKKKMEENNQDFESFMSAVGVKNEGPISNEIEFVGHTKMYEVETYVVKATIEQYPKCETCNYLSCKERKKSI